MAASKNLTPSERSMRASLAANTRWANTDRAKASEDARRRQLDRFEQMVDPDGTLPVDERMARAENARRAHMQALALKSARARRAKARHDQAAYVAGREAS